MLFVGKSEFELALWATEYLTPHRYLHRYLRLPTVSQASQAQAKKKRVHAPLLELERIH